MKVLRYISVIAALLLSGVVADAQTEPFRRAAVIREIKYSIKDGDYNKVLTSVKNAFGQYPDETLGDAEFHYFNAVAYNQLALAEARKMYLQDNPDTAKYFSNVYSMMVEGRACDSLASIPNAKGKVDNRFRKEIAGLLSQGTVKLPAAAKYFFQKKDYGKAYKYADLYLTNTVFVGHEYGIRGAQIRYSWGTDTVSVNKASQEPENPETITMSTVSVLSAYSLENYANAVKYSDMALRDSSLHEEILEIVCHSYEQLHDTAAYERSLEVGVIMYPGNKYFYASLIGLYNSQDMFRKSLDVVNDVLRTHPDDRDLWFVKGTEELYLGEQDKALLSFNNAVSLKADDAESYSNIGNIYLHKANLLYQKERGLKGKELRTLRAELHMTYNNAKGAFENARKYAEQRTDLWLAGLKEVYYKLNMGKELMLLEYTYK